MSGASPPLKRVKHALPSNVVYLDYLATTPLCDETIKAMTTLMASTDSWVNPSSTSHALGRSAASKLADARARVAGLIGASPSEIIFESCSTETINHVIHSVVSAAPLDQRRVVTSELEHPAVERALAAFCAAEDVTRVPIRDPHRVPSAEDVAAALVPRKTCLVTLMLANNETGAVFPIKDVVRAVRRVDPGVFVHVDASQGCGKIPVDVRELDCDALTLAGHKLYGPKGVAALWLRSGRVLKPFVHGASQERGLRAGTENLLLATGLAAACEVAMKDVRLESMEKTRELRRELFRSLETRLRASGCRVEDNGPREEARRLPGALSVSVSHPTRALPGHRLVVACGEQGLILSAGAACHAGETKPSAVLLASGIPAERAAGTLRLCVGRETTREEIREAAEILGRVVDAELGGAP